MHSLAGQIHRLVLAVLLVAGTWPLTPAQLTLAAAGDVDSSFGGGAISTDFAGDAGSDVARALVLQPDGRLVAAGRSVGDFALARYLPDGRLDASFGAGGKVVGPAGSARALVRQEDGRLIAAGASAGDFALVRYLPDGGPDLSFGTVGKVTTDFGGDDAAHALLQQPDGKLIAAGHTGTNFALARYLPDGRLDASFGAGGKVVGPAGSANALVWQADGRLVVAGGSAGDFALVRYAPNGSLDATFGNGGKSTTDFFGGDDAANAVVLQPDGKLVAAGSANPPLNSVFALARYLGNGSLDTSFGMGGKVTVDFEADYGGDVANALVLLPDGKLIAAGAGGGGERFSPFALAGLDANGDPDASFGRGGMVLTDFTGNRQGTSVYALVRQPDGKLVAAGSSGWGAGDVPEDFGLVRYLGAPVDGSLPTCSAPTSGTDAQGRKIITVKVRDTGNGVAGQGLKSVEVTTLTNATVALNPAPTSGPGSGLGVRSYSPPTTTEVTVTATKLNQAQSSQLALKLTDASGNVTACDPVSLSVGRDPGKPETVTLTNLPRAEGTIEITNGTPGLTHLDIVVNGQTFKLNGLKDGETRTLDVRSAMRPGNANTIALTARGKPGGTADILVSDAAPAAAVTAGRSGR